ncbi:MAG: DLW-39 family protein [Jatrophihabitantaceae bacterium]
MKKLLMLAAAAAGMQYVMKRKKGQDSREVWKQATR